MPMTPLPSFLCPLWAYKTKWHVASQTFNQQSGTAAHGQNIPAFRHRFLTVLCQNFPITGKLVARLPTDQQADFADLLQGAAGKDVDAGVMAANHQDHQHYWAFWADYIAPFTELDKMLTAVLDPTQIKLLLRFALTGSGGANTGMALKSKLAPFKLCYVPLARHWNWKDFPIPPTAAKASTD